MSISYVKIATGFLKPIIALIKLIIYTWIVRRIRERMSPGGLRGLQIRWGAL